jgi:lipopolysaccharide export system protein LptA
VEAAKVVLDFRNDNSVQHVTATGGVRIQKSGPETANVSAPRADLDLNEKNSLESAVLSGGVRMQANGPTMARGTAGKLLLTFGPDNTVKKVRAAEGARILQANTEAANKQTVAVESNALDLYIAGGRLLDRAESSSHTEVTVVPRIVDSFEDLSRGERRVLSAGRLVSDFDARGKLKTITGNEGAKVAFYTPGQPDKVTTSRELVAHVQPSGGTERIEQAGDFKYSEQTAGSAASRRATAERATYTSASEAIVLTGSPRVVDAGLSATAEVVRLNRKTGDATAEGDVKTTYSELRAQPSGAMLASSDPIHVTSAQLAVDRKTSVARYTGGARLWQGSNIVEANTIEFDRDQRSVLAEGAGNRVSCVFVQQDSSGRQTPIVITAAKLAYVDQQRRARFSGGVVAKGAEITVNADNVDVVLLARNISARDTGGPSQLDEIIASGHVSLQQPNRRATGDKLVYRAAESKFTLSGGPPTVTDAQRGTIRGTVLTFYSRDDRVLVESSGNTRTVTRTRVSR